MRTSLREIEEIEKFLEGTMGAEDRLALEAKMLTSPAWSDLVMLQKELLKLVQVHGRRELRSEIADIQYDLFHNPIHLAFKQKVLELFL